MNVRVASASIIALAAAVGCSTIRNARDAQDSVAAKGAGGVVSESRVDFRGRSLEWLVGFAMTNRPSVVAARLDVEDARLAMKSIAADAPLVSGTPWTALSLSASGGYSAASPGTSLKDHRFSTKGDASAALSLNLLVWDFGRNAARARAQAEAVVASEIALLREGFVVFEEVSDSYFTFLERNSLLEVALTNQAQYAERLLQAERRLDAGEADRLDVLKARLDLAKARQATVAASNLVATSGARLMDALGVDASRGTCEEAFGDVRLGMDEVARAFARTDYGVGEVFDFARTNAPSVQVARARLRAASHDVDYAVADLMPELSASASLRWADPLWFWQWGVSAVQSLFQGFRRTTAVDRAVVAMRKAEASVDAAEQSLSSSLESAVAVRDNSVEALRSAVASVRSAKENLDTAREQLLVGTVSRVELSDAIASYSTALGDSIEAFYAGQRAEAALFALVGKFPEYSEGTVMGGGDED
ncbi:MAG: TolC family protein [Kiritimatiellae bacterium]|nr:TolC family protein [Kiritimatiellia bacterium]